MRQVKLMAVFGTRPEAIKMAPVIKALSSVSRFHTKICVTAQHRKMLDQVLSLYHIKPHFDLNIMVADQSLSRITQLTMQGLETVFTEFKPDWLLVQGDTNTTFAASLAAYYNKIPVAHIEAGLRTHHIYSPFPEEINRQLTARIAHLHFAPTALARQNLLNEGISADKIAVTGNTVIDAILGAVDYIKHNPIFKKQINEKFSFLNGNKKLILVTSHRRENFREALEHVCRALLYISHREDVQIVYPIHLNPNIRKTVFQLLKSKKNIYLLDPQGYLPFVYLMLKSYLIVTDSGGIQEEAPSLGKPVLVVRETTERLEGIHAGTTRLVGTNETQLIQHIQELLEKEKSYQHMLIPTNPYGDGKAAIRISERLQYECRIE